MPFDKHLKARVAAGDFVDWNDRAIATLSQLWAEGLAVNEIAKRMGISRNAVVGKKVRLNLAPRPSPIIRTGVRKARRAAPRTGLIPALAPAVVPVAEAPAKAPAVVPVTIPPARCGCKFPMWGHREKPTHMYCGEPVEREGYCGVHAAICFMRLAA